MSRFPGPVMGLVLRVLLVPRLRCGCDRSEIWWGWWPGGRDAQWARCSVGRMQRAADVHGGKDGEHESLNETHANFEGGEGDQAKE